MTTTHRAVAAQALVRTVANGGTTVSLTGEVPTTGYVVGGLVTETVLDVRDFTSWDVEIFIEEHVHTLREEGRYLGTWIDTQTGHVHLDVVSVFAIEDTAAAVARYRSEIAYFDLSTGREIKVGARVS